MLIRIASILVLAAMSAGCASVKKAVPTAKTCNYEPFLVGCTPVCTTTSAGCTVCTCGPSDGHAQFGTVQERSP